MWTAGRTNRRTDMTKLTVAFRNFVSAPKMAVTLTVLNNFPISEGFHFPRIDRDIRSEEFHLLHFIYDTHFLVI
jgi:hypothetical protein